MATPFRRQFAPLKEGTPPEAGVLLKGVVFDVDGTLCKPQNYMFAEMRLALGIPKTVDILDHVYSLPTAEAQQQAMEAIRAIERRAMALQVAQPGLARLMSYLDAKQIRKGICTRNFEAPVAHLLTKFLPAHAFEPIVTREFRPPKPDPAGILHIARSWGLLAAQPAPAAGEGAASDGKIQPGIAGSQGHDGRQGAEELVIDTSGVIMVGDSIDDMTAGRRAGAATVLLVNDANAHLVEHEHTDLVISRLDELIDVLEHGFAVRQV